MSALSLTEARRRLFPLVREVNDNAEVVQIGSGDDTAFLVPADMWRSISETAYMLRSPANALDSVMRSLTLTLLAIGLTPTSTRSPLREARPPAPGMGGRYVVRHPMIEPCASA